jgi:signal transduction histidine kinase
VPVELGPLPAERLPPAVETTAYFVVVEALTNASKHGRCDRADIVVRVAEGWVIVQIRDDGVGGADPSGGSGLRGLTDRVRALGGELEVESASGMGTAVTARIPLSAYDADPIAALGTAPRASSTQ